MKKLGFGLMRLPLKNAQDVLSIDQDLVNKMADYFIANGFTYFDTAYIYHQGTSEGAIKKAVVDRYPRHSFLLADKMPVWLVKDYLDYNKIFNQQLQRCGVEYFDYYLVHSLGAKTYAETVEKGGFEFVKEMKAKGKIKTLGLSFHDKAQVLDKILTEQPYMEFVQLQINYIDWEDYTIQSRLCHEIAVKHNKPIIVMEPIKGGSLASVPDDINTLFKNYNAKASAASWAVRYAASLKNVFMVLSGMSDFAQMQDNISYMKDFIPFNNQEFNIAKTAGDILRSKISVPCTACGYCLDGCPKKIPISKCFSLYNNQSQFGLKPMHFTHYINATHEAGRAFDCIKCKACEHHCPQHIEISKRLVDVSKVFEPKLWR